MVTLFNPSSIQIIFAKHKNTLEFLIYLTIDSTVNERIKSIDKSGNVSLILVGDDITSVRKPISFAFCNNFMIVFENIDTCPFISPFFIRPGRIRNIVLHVILSE